MNRLAELIERVERLTGPDREVDLLIGEAANAEMGLSGDAVGLGYPKYTSSVDAALALTERVLPGWIWLKPRWNELSVYRPADGDCEVVEYASDHSIPAIALVLATLKALAAQEQADG